MKECLHGRRRVLGWSVVFAVAVLPLPAHAQAPTGEPIKLGAVLSITGPGAGLGIAERNGMQLAEKVINERGGIHGRPLKILIEDDGSKADLAKTKAENLIFDEKVKIMLGPSLGATVGAIGTITNAQRIPHLTLTGLLRPEERTYKSMFHLLPTLELNAKGMLEYTTKALHGRKVGVLHDSGYGQVVMANLTRLAPAYGIEFIAVEKFEVGANDVSTQAAKVRAANPEVVFVVATSPVPFRNARQMKLSQPIVSAIGSAAYEYLRGMGEFANDIVFPEYLVSEDPLPNQLEFVTLYRKTYGHPPKNYEAAAWDAVQIAAKALAKVGPDASSEAIAEAMRGRHEGVMTRYDFRADDLTGIELSGFVFSKVVNGEFTRLPFKAGK